MKLIHKLSVLAIALGSLVVLPLNASAQATCDNDDEVLACNAGAIADCRSAWSCEDSSDTTTLTSQDVVDDAAECCTKSQKKARKCLNRYQKKLGESVSKAPTFVKGFLRYSRTKVRLLRLNGCDTGTLGDL
ncbi:MAG: hypothetical protein J5J00_04595 [Deltaproteobacteria bacterium]|nr:hypothetical protein [Deltaproteobacteria bacterium]